MKGCSRFRIPSQVQLEALRVRIRFWVWTPLACPLGRNLAPCRHCVRLGRPTQTQMTKFESWRGVSSSSFKVRVKFSRPAGACQCWSRSTAWVTIGWAINWVVNLNLECSKVFLMSAHYIHCGGKVFQSDVTAHKIPCDGILRFIPLAKFFPNGNLSVNIVMPVKSKVLYRNTLTPRLIPGLIQTWKSIWSYAQRKVKKTTSAACPGTKQWMILTWNPTLSPVSYSPGSWDAVANRCGYKLEASALISSQLPNHPLAILLLDDILWYNQAGAWAAI